MKKAILVVIGAALVVWVASWFRAPDAVAGAVAKPWPGGMGSLQGVMARFPPNSANDAARKLAALASAMPKNDAVGIFALHEIARGDAAIGKAPPLPDVSAIRELLLREPIVWKRESGVGGGNDMNAMRVMVMTLARALVANALAHGTWEDLHAVWNLARSLDLLPQVMMQTAALTMVRMINAVAWKMPLPAPPWFAEVQARDPVRRLLEAFQYQAASYCNGIFPTKFLAASIEHDRQIANLLSANTACDVHSQPNELGTDLTWVWRRAFRYRVEREATANALRVREGRPIETKSMCSDGAWSFDGTTLRFSRDIPSLPGDVSMPLVLRIQS